MFCLKPTSLMRALVEQVQYKAAIPVTILLCFILGCIARNASSIVAYAPECHWPDDQLVHISFSSAEKPLKSD